MGFSVDSPRITKGLGVYQPDYYAALGIPVTATPDQITDAYKKAARSPALRPGFLGHKTAEGQYATWLVSKLINPAKELLTKEKEKVEYDATLRIQIRQLAEDKSRNPWPTSATAMELRNAANLDEAYEQALTKIVASQFSELYQILNAASEASELNLTYLLCRTYPSYKSTGQMVTGNQPIVTPTRTPIPPIPTNPGGPTTIPRNPTGAQPIPTPSQPTGSFAIPREERPKPTTPPLTPSETRFVQATQLAEKGDYKQAIQFFNLAISMNLENPDYYLERGITHQKLGNRSAARSDFQKVLELDPRQTKVKQMLKELEGDTIPPTPPPQRIPTGKLPPTPPDKKPPDKKSDGKSGSGGFFGGLFGRKP